MNKLKRCFEIAEQLGWSVEPEDGSVYDFGKYSPAGQDFHASIDTEGDAEAFLRNLREYICNYDVSEEAYIWLDSTGHGTKGAPYDMKDVYEDMEACEAAMEELADAVEEALSGKITGR